jgi:hypothetical protein
VEHFITEIGLNRETALAEVATRDQKLGRI